MLKSLERALTVAMIVLFIVFVVMFIHLNPNLF